MGHQVSWLLRAAVVATAASAAAVTVSPATARPGSEHGDATTSCATLGQGATGAAVKTVQRILGTTADGDFGPNTAKAVKTWQTSHEIASSGVVDPATWASFPPRRARLACSRHVAGSGVTAGCATLAAGDQGVAVAVLQRALRVSPDGQFGTATRRALRAAQAAAKVSVTGTTGRATWRALGLRGTPACTRAGSGRPSDAQAQARVQARVQQMAATLQQVPGTTSDKVARQAMHFAKAQIGKPYRYGGTGPSSYDCSGLQMTAYRHAGLTIPRVAADQYAGAGKRFPLDQAQQGDLLFYANDLTQPQTTYHVVMYVGHDQILDAPYTGKDVGTRQLWTQNLLPHVVRPTANLALPMRAGDTGWSVTQLQQALNRHGAGLTVDGGFGPSTTAAVKAWQAKQSLKATGVVRLRTWLTLG